MNHQALLCAVDELEISKVQTMTINYLDILNLAKQNQWDKAHELVQPHYEQMACLIHGYLHRVEGDLGNARYWYYQANEKMPANTLAEEFERLYALAQQQSC